ncbi:MAG TPA: hypothetical protein PK478_12055 [Nitrospira sp.]|nr:hypothetical protein [Nitrospira sp.]
MADTSYRVWFGCRINGVEYERGQLVTLDSANAGVQAALLHTIKRRKSSGSTSTARKSSK